MAKSVASNRGGNQQPLRRETTSDNELEIPGRRRYLTSDTDEPFVNRSGYYTASDAEPESSTVGFPTHHILREPPKSPEQIEYETIYPTVDNVSDSKTASGNHTSEIDMDDGNTYSSAKRDSPLPPMSYSDEPSVDEGEEADDEAQDEITSDVPMSPTSRNFTENTSEFVKMETPELPANDRYPLNSSAQEVVVIGSDDRGEGELIEISDDDDPRSPHEELDPRSLHEEWETSLIGDDGGSETSYHSGESCFFSIFC